jgi:predicted transposase/invertase (TIGR01784 family)
MQKAKINFFKDRAVFYTTFPIKEQAEKGKWDFKLKPVYCIAILDFEFDKKTANNDYLNKVSLKNQYCEEFYDKLKYIFIEMPRFNKKESELTTHFEKWLYFIKNLVDFEDIPSVLKEPVFEKGFETARVSALDKPQYKEYEQSLLQYWDMTSAIDTAFDDGEKKGFEKGIQKGIQKGIEKGIEKGIQKGAKAEKLQIAKNLLKNNIDIEIIIQSTGLTQTEIEDLQK